jgi:hypothetical protein
MFYAIGGEPRRPSLPTQPISDKQAPNSGWYGLDMVPMSQMLRVLKCKPHF